MFADFAGVGYGNQVPYPQGGKANGWLCQVSAYRFARYSAEGEDIFRIQYYSCRHGLRDRLIHDLLAMAFISPWSPSSAGVRSGECHTFRTISFFNFERLNVIYRSS